MAQADFDFINNGTAPDGGNDGRSVIHSTLSSPLLLQGDFGRRYRWATGDNTLLSVLGAGVDGGIWTPSGTTHAFDVWAAVRVDGAGTPNKAMGVSVKTGAIGAAPYTNLPSGYHLFVGAWNINGIVVGSPSALTLLMTNEDGEGDRGGTAEGYRAITVVGNLVADEWHYIRLSVVPNGATEDVVKCYTGTRNVGVNASIIAGAPTGVSGTGATMSAPLPPPDSTFINVTGLSGITQADRGRYLAISGAADPLNNRAFRIYNVISSTEVQIIAALDASGSVVTPGGEAGLDWSTAQMRVSNVANLTSRSVGRQLTLSGATAPGNDGSFFIVAADGTNADVVNANATIPDLNNGNISYIEGAAPPAIPTDPIWVEQTTEVVENTENYYCPWGDPTSNRIGFVAHNSASVGDEVYVDAFNATREAV